MTDVFGIHGKHVAQAKGFTAVILLYETNHGTFWVSIPLGAVRLCTAVSYLSESFNKVYYSKRHKLEDVF